MTVSIRTPALIAVLAFALVLALPARAFMPTFPPPTQDPLEGLILLAQSCDGDCPKEPKDDKDPTPGAHGLRVPHTRALVNKIRQANKTCSAPLRPEYRLDCLRAVKSAAVRKTVRQAAAVVEETARVILRPGGDPNRRPAQ